ncbi:hypothetical protein [Methanothermobacter sp.]|uniref:hypothetical protein n=1 Tax=Methanothermobacter sp. TaxID=1884223 RepID=UPI003C77D8A9
MVWHGLRASDRCGEGAANPLCGAPPFTCRIIDSKGLQESLAPTQRAFVIYDVNRSLMVMGGG